MDGNPDNGAATRKRPAPGTEGASFDATEPYFRMAGEDVSARYELPSRQLDRVQVPAPERTAPMGVRPDAARGEAAPRGTGD